MAEYSHHLVTSLTVSPQRLARSSLMMEFSRQDREQYDLMSQPITFVVHQQFVSRFFSSL